jgi:arylsulfatase A-like enzyme
LNNTDHSRAARGDLLGVGLALALSAGIIDVCVALLDKPRGFDTLTSLAPSILATAAMTLPVYLVLTSVLTPIATRIGLESRSFAAALAACLGCVFTLVVLTGLHVAQLSPQTVFRAAIVGSLSALLGAGIYSMEVTNDRTRGARAGFRSMAVLLPVLLFELLVFEWAQVYAIDRFLSAPSVLTVLAFIAAVAAAVGFVRHAERAAWSQPWVLITFTVLLAVAPLVGMVEWHKQSTVQASGPGSVRTPKRIVLITVDTLRADALSAYRSNAPRTAAIDRLADDGMVFEHAVAPAPWTLPSLTSILTGLSPEAHQATGFTSRVSASITTLAESLSAHGYYTTAIVHNDLLNPMNGLSQGFAEYTSLYEQWFANALGMRTLQTLAPAWFPPASWPSNDDQTRLVEKWLASNRDRNFFLWVHYFDPHAPYAPPREYRVAEPLATIGPSFEGQKTAAQGFFVPSVPEREAIRSLYDGEVRYVDANIGRVVATLQQLRLYDDALIVFTSDHGEEFWEHGRVGHGHSVYDELLRVPLIVKLPGAAERGRTAAAVSTASVTPTILDVSGIRYDAGNVSAPSLRPLIDPAAGIYQPQPVVSGAQIIFDRREAVLFDGFKYIVSTVDGHEELFDLQADPGERHSMAHSAPERLAQAHRLLEAHSAAAAGLRKRLRIEEGAIQADEDTVRRLRSLGYLK